MSASSKPDTAVSVAYADGAMLEAILARKGRPSRMSAPVLDRAGSLTPESRRKVEGETLPWLAIEKRAFAIHVLVKMSVHLGSWT